MKYVGYLVRKQTAEIEFEADSDDEADEWFASNAWGNVNEANNVYTDQWDYDESPQVVDVPIIADTLDSIEIMPGGCGERR